MTSRYFRAAMLGGVLLAVGSVPAVSQSTKGVRGGTPEFTYGSPTDRALVARIREQTGTTVPPAVRLEGTLQWRGASASQRWGVTLQWPTLYQQRTAEIIHTLNRGVYSTNAGTPPSAQEIARENVRDRFGDLSLLILARPHVAGMSVKAEGTGTVEGSPVRKLVVRDHLGPWLTLYVHATDDRIVATGRPWTVDNESVEQLTIVRERRAIDGVSVPVRLEQLTGKHGAVIAVKATVGTRAVADSR